MDQHKFCMTRCHRAVSSGQGRCTPLWSCGGSADRWRPTRPSCPGRPRLSDSAREPQGERRAQTASLQGQRGSAGGCARREPRAARCAQRTSCTPAAPAVQHCRSSMGPERVCTAALPPGLQKLWSSSWSDRGHPESCTGLGALSPPLAGSCKQLCNLRHHRRYRLYMISYPVRRWPRSLHLCCCHST